MLVEGGTRARIVRYTDNPAFFQAYAEAMPEQLGEKSEIEALTRTVVTQFEQYIKLNRKIPPEVLADVFRACRREDIAGLKQAPGGSIVTFAMTQLAISATQIRKLLANGLSARYLLPDTVLDYIQSRGLYI